MSKKLNDFPGIARKLAEQIHPTHFYVDEDGYYSCKAEPERMETYGYGSCDCGLEQKRAKTAELIQTALEEAADGARWGMVGILYD